MWQISFSIIYVWIEAVHRYRKQLWLYSNSWLCGMLWWSCFPGLLINWPDRSSSLFREGDFFVFKLSWDDWHINESSAENELGNNASVTIDDYHSWGTLTYNKQVSSGRGAVHLFLFENVFHPPYADFAFLCTLILLVSTEISHTVWMLVYRRAVRWRW